MYWKELLVGGFGGLILVMLDFLEDGKKLPAARRPKDQYFWAGVFFWPSVGGIFTWINLDSGVAVNTIGALGIGLAAPTTIATLAQKGIGIIGGPPKRSEP